MRMMSAQDFLEVRAWMYRNARPLELARWRYHFENAGREGVLQALSVYQNPDGGFGHALEADNWNPDSSPFTTGTAIELFRELGIFDPHHPMVEKAFHYLESVPCLPMMGWPFTVPTNSDHPHAPWWTYGEENNIQNGFHASGNLAGYILRCGDTESTLYQKAFSVAQEMVDKLRRAGTTDVHEIGANAVLLQDILAAGLEEQFDATELRGRLMKMVSQALQRDRGSWSGYSMRPSHYIDSPQSLFYKGNEEVTGEELDNILNTRKTGGVWDIYWSWADYPAEFAIARRWWQGNLALRYTLLMKNFGRLEAALEDRPQEYALKECVSVYYTKNMDETVKWFKDVLGWHGEVIDRNDKAEGTYGFVSQSPKEEVVSGAAPFWGFHLWYGEPSKQTVALLQVRNIHALRDRVKKSGWEQMGELQKTGASSQTCNITTIDGSVLMCFQ